MTRGGEICDGFFGFLILLMLRPLTALSPPLNDPTVARGKYLNGRSDVTLANCVTFFGHFIVERPAPRGEASVRHPRPAAEADRAPPRFHIMGSPGSSEDVRHAGIGGRRQVQQPSPRFLGNVQRPDEVMHDFPRYDPASGQ